MRRGLRTIHWVLTSAVLTACGTLVVPPARGAEPATSLRKRSGVVGSATCAAANCHGNAETRDSRVWKRSFTLWATRDPHRRAFDALYTPRAIDMYWQLNDATPPADAAMERADQIAIPDPDSGRYLEFLEQRCIGCHATPACDAPVESRPVVGHDANLATLANDRRHPADYSNGVSCESCHGPAERWLAEHYSVDWPQRPAADREERFGLAPTTQLSGRASVCVSCHVGPARRENQTYRVDHELIAAGHPRLDFEFSSALANLPPHWDTGADRARHARDTGSSSFHFDAWQHGQRQVARSVVRLYDNDQTNSRPLDFAHFDCFACHQRLRGDESRPLELQGPRGAPRLRLDPFRALLAEDSAVVLAIHDRQLRSFTPRVDTSGLASILDSNATTKPLNFLQQQQLLRRLANELKSPFSGNWDAAVGWDLAVRAWLADHDPQSESPLAQEVARFHQELNRCFTVESPTQYDSPDQFRAHEATLRETLERVLKQVEAAQP